MEIKSAVFDLSHDIKTLVLFNKPYLIFINTISDKVIKKIELPMNNVEDVTFSPDSSSVLLKLSREAYLLINWMNT
ncbi:MAG: hypothetical protein K0B14_17980 [Anaerolineaceae bacterium]|nr:hypothetical protein [Anaerolineaceae bacterium]